jgi:hypothetical protein
MSNEIALLAASVVTSLAPFTPYLVEGGKKMVEVIAEKGGEAAWQKAQALWDKVMARHSDDNRIKGAALMVSANPADELAQKQLAIALGARLKEDPLLIEELHKILGGREALQQVVADRSSWVEDITQDMQGTGTQEVVADQDSVIKGVRQIKK